MVRDFSKINFHEFVNEGLAVNGFRISNITFELMQNRLNDFMNFVNSIRLEYKSLYGWDIESREYFLNGMVDKWKYSFVIFNKNDEICFLNFSSVYGNIIHNHCTYAPKRNPKL